MTQTAEEADGRGIDMPMFAMLSKDYPPEIHKPLMLFPVRPYVEKCWVYYRHRVFAELDNGWVIVKANRPFIQFDADALQVRNATGGEEPRPFFLEIDGARGGGVIFFGWPDLRILDYDIKHRHWLGEWRNG